MARSSKTGERLKSTDWSLQRPVRRPIHTRQHSHRRTILRNEAALTNADAPAMLVLSCGWLARLFPLYRQCGFFAMNRHFPELARETLIDASPSLRRFVGTQLRGHSGPLCLDPLAAQDAASRNG
jgi:hypothetical protein